MSKQSINLASATNNYLVLGTEVDKQLLYSMDRPHFRFPINEVKRGGKTILKPVEKPIWSNIILEIPTRPLTSTKEWMDSKNLRELRMVVMNRDGNITEEWQIRDAQVLSFGTTIGRMVGIEVIRLVVNYSWARRVR